MCYSLSFFRWWHACCKYVCAYTSAHSDTHTRARARIWIRIKYMYIFVIRYIHIYETYELLSLLKNNKIYLRMSTHILWIREPCNNADRQDSPTSLPPSHQQPSTHLSRRPPQEKTGGDTARAAETAGGKDAASREVHDSLRAPRCPCRVARRETRRSKGRRGRYTCRRGRRQGTFRCRQMMMTQNSCYSCLVFQILSMIFIRVFFFHLPKVNNYLE